MKTVSISLVAIFITSLGIAQNSHSEFQQIKSIDLGNVSSNYEYLDEVQNGIIPKHVKDLENLVSYFDIAQLEKFDGGSAKEWYVNFKSDQGQILASYDYKGTVISTQERYRNVALPRPVVIAILKQHPNWIIVKNKYSILYAKNKRPMKQLRVQIGKDNQKKWLKIDSEGRIM